MLGEAESPDQGCAFRMGWNWDSNPVWLIPKPQLLCQKEKEWLSIIRDFWNIELKVKHKWSKKNRILNIVLG